MLQLLSPSASQHSSINDLQQSSATLIYEIGQQFAASSSIQAEAVAKASSLLDKYPFPTFVNALFGRLAELYVADQTNDFVRLQILKAFEQSHRHLNKLSGVNLLFDKIFQVTYNTDDIARAITLRLLGTMNSVIPPSKADIVRHKIINSLDSQSEEELDAALFAATKFSKASLQFSHGVFEKLAAKFISVNTDFATREKLAKCLVGLEYDNALFGKAIQMVENSMEVVVDRDSSVLLLKSLTGIALQNFVYVLEVSHILSRALSVFTVVKEQLVVLQCLLKLTPYAHLWKDEVVTMICALASKSSVGSIRAGCFHIFLNIFEMNANFLSFPLQMRELALASLRKGSFLSIYGSLALILSDISVREVEMICSPTLHLDLMLHFQYCVAKIAEFRAYETHKFLVKKLLKAIKIACKRKLFDIGEFSQMLLPLIFDSCLKKQQYHFASAILSTLINAISATGESLNVPSVSSFFTEERFISLPAAFTTLALKFMLCCSSQSVDNEASLAAQLLTSCNRLMISPWQLYQLAAFGIRCGRLKFTGDILRHLLDAYTEFLSLFSSRFLELLLAIVTSHLELLLLKFSFFDVQSCADTLRSVRAKFVDVDFICRSLVSHESSIYRSSGSHQLVTHFRSTWIRVSNNVLNVASDFISKLCRLNLLMSKSTDTDKYLRVMFKDTVFGLSRAAEDVATLRSILIDADDVTLEELNQSHRVLMAVHSVISLIATDGRTCPGVSAEKVKSIGEHLSLPTNRGGSFCASLKTLSDALSNTASAGVEVLLEACGSVVINACRFFAKLPPMFFSASQHTVVKLSLSPQPQISGEPLIMLQDTAFVLKVEGVIEQKSNSEKVPLRRSVKHVHIQATFSLKSTESEQAKQQVTRLETTELVVNDFFSTEFSFQPDVTDLFLIRVFVDAIDESGMRWLVCSGIGSGGTATEQAPQLLLKSVSQLVRTPSQTQTSASATRSVSKVSA